MSLDYFETDKVENKVQLDFKKDYIKWFKTICAFANSKGGVMNVGINNALEEVGYSIEEIDSLQRSINAICRNHSNPVVKCNYEVVKIKDKVDKYYLKVIVEKRKSAITWLVDEAFSPLLYVRHEGETVLASVEEQIELLTTSSLYAYDAIETGVEYSEVSFNSLEEEYALNNDNETLTKKKLVSFGLVTSDDRLTIAGMLFSDNNINKNSNMICTTWPSLTKGTNDYQDSKSFEGSLVMLLHKAIEYIKEVPYYYFGGEKRGLTRFDVGSFSIASLREALVNALAHRDYRIDGNEIAINCFPDRIEITSPGALLQNNEIIIRRKLDPASYPSVRRNKTICGVFEKCRLMENKGSGFEKITEDYIGLGEEYFPWYSANKISFTLALINKKYKYNNTITENNVALPSFNSVIKQPMFMLRQDLFVSNPRYLEIQTLIQNNSYVTIELLAKETGLTKDGVKYNIRKMKEACLIRKAPGGYEIVNDLDRPAEYIKLEKDVLINVINWCKDNFIKGTSVYKDYSSYYYKHVFEKDLGIYLTNGQFKAAMLLAGFECDDVEKLNWNFKILKTSPANKKESKA